MKQHRHYQKGISTTIRHNLLKSRGDTLIEVLITFFVIAVGILGASSMQIVALQNVNGASYRDQAVIIAENLSERLRAVGTAGYENLIAPIRQPQNIADLPSGDMQATETTNTVTITVRWDEDRSGGNGRNCTATSTTNDLDCYEVTLLR